MDEVVEQIMESEFQFEFIAGIATVLSSGMAIGYVSWALRGTSLVASVMAHLPMWQLIDPILVLDSFDRQGKNKVGKDESLESIVTKV